MAVILICNVGSRDVQLDGKMIPADHARQTGEKCLVNFKEMQGRLSYPIVEKSVEYVLLEDKRLDELILIASDQPEGSFSESETDTVNYAKIIKKHYSTHGNITKIKTFYINSNPADYDEMIDFYSMLMPNFVATDERQHKTYLSLAGGTPAMNFALLFVGSEILGKSTQALYVSRKLTRPTKLQVGLKLFRKTMLDTLLTSVNAFDYESALAILQGDDELFDSRAQSKIVECLLIYAKERASFNFSAAEESLDDAITVARGEVRNNLVALRDRLLYPTEEFFLEEVIHNSEMKFLKGQYLDYLSRLFRFQEGCLRFLGTQLGVKLNKSGIHLDLEWVEGDQALLKKFKAAKLDYKREVNRHLLRTAVEYQLSKQIGTKFERVLESLDRIESLASLRNKTIVAHDYKGVNRQQLCERFGEDADSIILLMRFIYRQIVGKDTDQNCFRQINMFCTGVVTADY